MTFPSRLAIVKGDERKINISRAIKAIKNNIMLSIKQKKIDQLFIKINVVAHNFPRACTHPDALDAVLHMFYDKFENIIIGDNTIPRGGGIYQKILKKYPKIIFSNLTEFETENIIFRQNKGITKTGLLSLLPRQSYTISLALPKAHDTFVYTGCLKNMFGCVIKNRNHLHAVNFYERLLLNNYVKTNQIKWENLNNIIKKTMPDLCILDAYEGMENGPIDGNTVRMGLALASLDGISLDRITSKICGLSHVPYLSKLPGNKEIMFIKEGFQDIDEISIKLRPHYLNFYQIRTKIPSIPIIDYKYAAYIARNFLKKKLFGIY